MIIDLLHGLALGMLVAAAAIAVRRMALGPTSLDRSIAADVVLAVVIAAIGLWTVRTKEAVGLPILVVLSLLGFTAAVAMARLISNRSDQIRMLHEERMPVEMPDDDGPDRWEGGDLHVD